MKTFWTGVSITAIYFIFLAIVIHFLHLNLMGSWNEFGDFLAGAFSPVAFLWLILGYLQQQKELQQNTRALELQAEELKNSVDQYKEMVRVANEQLEADRQVISRQYEMTELENKPDVCLKSARWSIRVGPVHHFKWPLINNGREARNVNFNITPTFGGWKDFSWKKFPDTEVLLPEITLKRDELPDELLITLSFESVFGKKYIKVYALSLGEEMHYEIKSETEM